jgi:hypothetical protein
MSERDEADRARREAPQPQDESTKRHGDKLDPVIPRGADQKGDADATGADDSDQGTQGT